MFQVKTYIRFSDFQAKSELFMTENVLPFTDEVIIILVHKCSQQLQLLALYLENARISTRFFLKDLGIYVKLVI